MLIHNEFIIECQIDNNMLFKGKVYERKIVIDSFSML